MNKTQVKKEHYDFDKYVNLERWSSYYYQLVNAMGGGYQFGAVGRGRGRDCFDDFEVAGV